MNRRLDLAEAYARGWIRIQDGAHNFSLPAAMYTEPGYQLRQLRSTGFDVCDVLDRSGASVPAHAPGRDAHLFYICTPAA